MTLAEKLQQKNLLNIYVTAGYPNFDSLPEIIATLAKEKVDLVEIGIPYSDPISDGKTIQESNAIALQNGIDLASIFEQLRTEQSPITKVMMGYFNSILQFGIERFCVSCQQVGVEGVIIPDLPPELYLESYASLFEQYQLSMIFLITPESSTERIHWIDQISTSFIYAVSRSGTTGTSGGIQQSTSYLQRINALKLTHPILIGFNIREGRDFELACQYVQGGIIGSAFIEQLKGSSNTKVQIEQFIARITKNTKR